MNDVVACLAELARPDIAVGGATVSDDSGLIGPEKDAVLRAIPKRRAEFAAGRLAARSAMQMAGFSPVAIPQEQTRAPLWPCGLVGSITHDAGLALAALASNDVISRLGIDLAEASDFPEHLRPRVLKTPAELTQSGLEARVSFSAKECVFKALFQDVGQYFGFGAVSVAP